MIPVKISSKGKVLLKNKPLCAKVIRAITNDHEFKLYSKGGLRVEWHGKTLTFQIK